MNGEITLNKIKREIVLPALRIQKKKLGKIYDVELTYMENEEQYKIRKDIMDVFNKGIVISIMKFKNNEYYRYLRGKKGHSIKTAFLKIIRYYLLFHSIKKEGFRSDIRRPESLPYLFVSKMSTSRFDGHHRISIARYFGYKRIPVLILTPKDLLGLSYISNDVISYLKIIGEPEKLTEKFNEIQDL
jgi:hypothetical protein